MFDFNNASLVQLKEFANEYGINPVGDKRLLITWKDAIAAFIEESKPVVEDAAYAVAGVATAVYAVATSEQAKKVYCKVIDNAGALFMYLACGAYDLGVATRRFYAWCNDGGLDDAIEYYYDNTGEVEKKVSAWVQWKSYVARCVVVEQADSVKRFVDGEIRSIRSALLIG